MRSKFFILLMLCCQLLNATQLDPKEVTFLFDIHDVFLKKAPSNVASAFWKYGYSLFNLPLLASLAKLGWTHLTDYEITSEEFMQAAIDNNSPSFTELIKEVAIAQQPIEGTVELIKELHNNGYRLHIGSNIGEYTFKELNDKNKHPQLASIFDYFDIPHSQISFHSPAKTIKKPQPQFFELYLKKNNNPDPQTIIFIDDLKQNIEVAKQFGFDTIHFKGPDQLRDELIKRGFTFLKPKSISQQHKPFTFENQLRYDSQE